MRFANFQSIFFGLLLLPMQNAMADTTECLQSAKGKVLRWNSRWAEPLVDNNEFYLVDTVDADKSSPNRLATLTLVAKGNAQKGSRTLVVSSTQQLASVCKRMTDYRGSLELSETAESLDLTSLPFIRHTKLGWVRDSTDAKQNELSLCIVFEKPFACLAEEKEQFGEELELVETQARFSGV